MISLLLGSLFVLLISGTISIISNKKIGHCMAPAIIAETLLMYVSGMIFKSFVPGIILAILSALVFFVLLFLKRKDIVSVSENLVTPGIIAFIIILMMLFVADYNDIFLEWDELSHWGMMVKEMFRTGVLYSENITNLYVHKEYPPFASLWELLLCKITGGYSEMITTFSLHLLVFALLLVGPCEKLFEKYNIKDKREFLKVTLWIFLFNVISLVMVNSMDLDHKFMSIYTDGLMGMEMFYAMILVYEFDEKSGLFDTIAIGSLLSAMVLTKQIGFAFALVIVFYLFIKNFGQYGNADVKKIVIAALAVLILPVGFWFSWRSYISHLEITGQQFDFSRISIGRVLDIIGGNGTEFELLVKDTYISKLLGDGVLGGHVIIPLILLIPMVWAFVLVMAFCFCKKKSMEQKGAVLFGLASSALVVGYVFTMFILYLFCFPNEAPAVCYNRYMSSIVMPIMLMMLYVIFKRLICCENKKRLLAATVVICMSCLILFDVTSLRALKPATMKKDTKARFRKIGDYINEYTEEGSSIYIVAKSNANYQYYVGYYANTRHMDFRSAMNFLELDYSDEYTVATVKEQMLENDYVYIQEFNDDFVSAYSDIVDTGEFKKKSLYKVVNDGDKTVLSLVDG